LHSVVDLFFQQLGVHPAPLSFPTRRSSDLYPGDWTGTGYHPLQGPLWVRPNTLLYEGVDLTQVVGHTPRVSVSHGGDCWFIDTLDRKSTRLNSSHVKISYAVFCLKKKNRQR